MKASLSIALVLSAALLSACGGSSKSKQSIAEFSLNSYEGRTVSSDSIVGTWVSVSEGEREEVYTEDDFTSTYNIASKEYFIIRDIGSGYAKESCYGWSSTVYESDGEIGFEGITGTLINNQRVSGMRTEEQNFSDWSYSEYTTFEMIKISDSTEAIGTMELAEAGNGSNVVDVKCFQQNSQVESWDASDDTATIESYLISRSDRSYVELFKWSSDLADSFTGIYAKGSFFNSDDNDTVDFRVSSESNVAHNISFNGSNEETDISGTIQIQLPSQ